MNKTSNETTGKWVAIKASYTAWCEKEDQTTMDHVQIPGAIAVNIHYRSGSLVEKLEKEVEERKTLPAAVVVAFHPQDERWKRDIASDESLALLVYAGARAIPFFLVDRVAMANIAHSEDNLTHHSCEGYRDAGYPASVTT